MIWLSFVLLVATSVFVFRTPFGLRLRSVGEQPRAAEMGATAGAPYEKQ